MASPIKSIQKSRLYSVLGNRSLYTNTLSQFFDTPSPQPPFPPSRPSNSHILTSTRIQFDNPPDSPTHNSNSQPTTPPYALALPVPSTSQLNTLSVSAAVPPPPLFLHPHPLLPDQSHLEQPNKEVNSGRPKYTLDVGAFGIPKRRGLPVEEPTGQDVELSVQVGEDAYFMQGTAMGVADGVGGWSRRAPIPVSGPTPSALFARRLMHFCASEISEAQNHPPYPVASEATNHAPQAPRSSVSCVPSSSVLTGSSQAQSYSEDEEAEFNSDDVVDLQESLDEFEDGLDVLMILERAYERTLRAHVVPASNLPSSAVPLAASPPHSRSLSTSPSPPPLPLLSGSSTALLAVLEQPNFRPSSRSPPSTSAYHSRHGLVFKPSTGSNNGAELKHPRMLPEPRDSRAHQIPLELIPDAILKIAHVGDSVGILVRGDQIVWRSEEMWSGFNTPAQLGPLSAFPPARAQTVTLPVCADDVLILASDGLSDNLWDVDVLAEVIRLRSAFLGPGTTSASTPPSLGTLLRRRTLAGILSEALCARAWRVGETQVGQTPFATRAQDFGHVFQGGKRDDISVVVAVVSPVVD